MNLLTTERTRAAFKSFFVFLFDIILWALFLLTNLVFIAAVHFKIHYERRWRRLVKIRMRECQGLKINFYVLE